MMGVGLLLGPLTGGDPLRGLLAGIAMGAVTAGAFALVERLRTRRSTDGEQLTHQLGVVAVRPGP